MKPTSLEAWARLKFSGTLGKRQLDTLIALIKHGPMTGQEVTQFVPNAWKRLSELEAKGVIRPGRERLCTVTNEKAIEWVVQVEATDEIPTIGHQPALM